jgi:hypothetical protein
MKMRVVCTLCDKKNEDGSPLPVIVIPPFSGRRKHLKKEHPEKFGNMSMEKLMKEYPKYFDFAEVEGYYKIRRSSTV